jgi:hypothetical protein
MWRKIKFYFVSLLIIGLAGLALYYRYFPQRGVTRRTVDTPAVLQQIQRLSELVTVKYNIQKVIGLEEQKVPFGSEKVLLLVQATVLGGVDLSQLSKQDVTSVDAGSLAISLPAPRVMHVFVNDNETKVWDRGKTWWTPWVDFNPELEQNARRAALEAVQQAALQMGILSNAQQNAETTIREFLRTAGITNVTFWTVRAQRAD